MPVNEQALETANILKTQLAGLIRSIVAALEDKKVSGFEGFDITMQGMNLANTALTRLRRVDKEYRDDLLYILEHGEITVTE